jgi:hypothetical protein
VSSKIVLIGILFLSLLLSSCGVKNDPINPQKNAYPSVMEEIHKKVKQNYYGDAEFDSSYR